MEYREGMSVLVTTDNPKLGGNLGKPYSKIYTIDLIDYDTVVAGGWWSKVCDICPADNAEEEE